MFITPKLEELEPIWHQIKEAYYKAVNLMAYNKWHYGISSTSFIVL
jgi:hypothetical protein